MNHLNNLHKIFRRGTGYFTTMFYRDIPLHTVEYPVIEPSVFPNLFDVLDKSDEIFLCFRYQEFEERWRAFFERHKFQDGKIIHEEVCSVNGNTLLDALNNLNTINLEDMIEGERNI